MAKQADRRSFASIRKLPSGRYQVRYTGPDGARHTAPHTFAHRIDAEGYAIKTRRAIDAEHWDAGDDDDPDTTTFGEYAEAWVACRTVSGRPLKPRTREHYAKLLADHILPTFGRRPVAAIKPAHVRAWHAATLPDRPTLRAHAYSLLRAILNSAVADDVIPSNPARIAGASTARRAAKVKPATIEELATITANMPDRLRLMVGLASWCALRFGEAVELRRADVDLGAAVVRVERAAYRVGGVYQVGTPKSDAGVREVAIPPHVLPEVREHLRRHTARPRDSLLFPADHGGHLQPSTLYRHFHRARDAAGRPDLRWHDLRHTGATLAAQTGATLAELMARLGHSTASAAMRYQHAAGGRDQQIAARLSQLATATAEGATP